MFTDDEATAVKTCRRETQCPGGCFPIEHDRKLFNLLMYRRISQITYQPKSVCKIDDFYTLNYFIFLNSSQMCTEFFKVLVTGYSLYLEKN